MGNGSYAFLSLLFSHGLTTAITLYLAVRGGAWLDRRFGTTPLFLAVLVILVVVANLRLLIKDILAEADRQSPSRGSNRSKRNPDDDGNRRPDQPGQAKERQVDDLEGDGNA